MYIEYLPWQLSTEDKIEQDLVLTSRSLETLEEDRQVNHNHNIVCYCVKVFCTGHCKKLVWEGHLNQAERQCM